MASSLFAMVSAPHLHITDVPPSGAAAVPQWRTPHERVLHNGLTTYSGLRPVVSRAMRRDVVGCGGNVANPCVSPCTGMWLGRFHRESGGDVVNPLWVMPHCGMAHCGIGEPKVSHLVRGADVAHRLNNVARVIIYHYLCAKQDDS